MSNADANYLEEVAVCTSQTDSLSADKYVLAFDTANEVIALGLGLLHPAFTHEQELPTLNIIASVEVEARRASNTQLLPRIDALLTSVGIARGNIACVVCGRGPGSFTGVRIAMATAKGIASALGVSLIGVSSLDAVAWGAWYEGVRGCVLVAADAMRKEVYPVRFDVHDDGIVRLESDHVMKAEEAAAEFFAGKESIESVDGKSVTAGISTETEQEACTGEEQLVATQDGVAAQADSRAASLPPLLITGDALRKYAHLFASCGTLLPENRWTPTGRGLLLAFEAAWRSGEVDPFDIKRHNPGLALPVYTRLSDAEENERVRLSKNDSKNLVAGVQDVEGHRAQRATMHVTSMLNARANEQGITYKPLDAAHAAQVAALETQIMGSDAWNESQVVDELPRANRAWWMALGSQEIGRSTEPADEHDGFAKQWLLGYAGGWVVDGQVQILKVGVLPEARRRGIARELLARVAADARDLGAQSCSLEVRVSNTGAQEFYQTIGLHTVGTRPRYYSDCEDAAIMKGPLPLTDYDVAGMKLHIDEARTEAATLLQGDTLKKPADPRIVDKTVIARPLILAIESSCDETAAAIVDGKGNLVADVVASQIDFHARFGGVVPEIASRKHIEAICGVCDECLEVTSAHLGVEGLNWHDLDAVAATYAPGLVGALVVGVAFAKGAAWAAEVPFIGVNHLEGHLYANKIGAPDFEPPAVVSLVSGGNTLLVHMKDWGDYTTLGATIDDAVGEAFDKVAKALGLGYPGGPAISRYAAEGNPEAIAFPRAMLHSGDLRFSLSGLKTAVVTYINQERAANRELNVPNICASFQQAVVDVQIAKAKTALQQTGARTFCLGGGVAANPVLRDAYRSLCKKLGVRLVLPPVSACGDNAGMIALVALDRYRQEKFFPLDADALAHTNLDDPY